MAISADPFHVYHCRGIEEFQRLARTLSSLKEIGFERIKAEEISPGAFIPVLVSRPSFFEWILEFFFCYKPVTLRMRETTQLALNFLKENHEFLTPEDRDLIVDLKGRITPKANVSCDFDQFIEMVYPSAEKALENAIQEKDAAIQSAQERADLLLNETQSLGTITLELVENQKSLRLMRERAEESKAQTIDIKAQAEKELRSKRARAIHTTRDMPVSKLFFERDTSGDVTIKCIDGQVKAHSSILSSCKKFSETTFTKDIIELWLRFLYAQECIIEVSSEQLFSLIQLIINVGPPELFVECKKILDRILDEYCHKMGSHSLPFDYHLHFFEMIGPDLLHFIDSGIIAKSKIEEIICSLCDYNLYERLMKSELFLHDKELIAYFSEVIGRRRKQ